jgi:hypothetical protein
MFGFVSFSEDTVVVTGFGPFGNYKINASWEAVKLLPSMNIEEEFGVKLIIHEIPVMYEYVAEKVPVLWEVHNPMVCIHFGFLTDLCRTFKSMALLNLYWPCTTANAWSSWP